MEVILAIIAGATSSGVCSIVLYLIQRKDKQKDAEKADETNQSKMLLGLGHDRIVFLTKKYIRRGAITVSEKANLSYLCPPYLAMGGNGEGENGYEECKHLPVVTEKEALRMDMEIMRDDFGVTYEKKKEKTENRNE